MDFPEHLKNLVNIFQLFPELLKRIKYATACIHK